MHQAWDWSRSRIVRAALLVTSVLGAQSAFGFGFSLNFSLPTQAGEWVAAVDIGTGPGGTFETEYYGVADNYGPLPGIPTGQGPSVPGGYPGNMAALSDPATGAIGVYGYNDNGGVTSGEASFYMNLQFSQFGVGQVVLHFNGLVDQTAQNTPSTPEGARLTGTVSERDLSAGTSQVIDSATICSPGELAQVGPGGGCGTVANSISTDLVIQFQVVPQHIYQVGWGEAGNDNGHASGFDGIDPSTMSIVLSSGLTLAPVNGFALPGFLAPAPPPGPPNGAPEPGTAFLMLSALAGLGFRARRRK